MGVVSVGKNLDPVVSVFTLLLSKCWQVWLSFSTPVGKAGVGCWNFGNAPTCGRHGLQLTEWLGAWIPEENTISHMQPFHSPLHHFLYQAAPGQAGEMKPG